MSIQTCTSYFTGVYLSGSWSEDTDPIACLLRSKFHDNKWSLLSGECGSDCILRLRRRIAYPLIGYHYPFLVLISSLTSPVASLLLFLPDQSTLSPTHSWCNVLALRLMGRPHLKQWPYVSVAHAGFCRTHKAHHAVVFMIEP